MKFKVLKPFFKLSEQRNYSVEEVIELSKEDAQAMLNDNFIEDINKTNKTQTFEISSDKLKSVLGNTNKPKKND